MGCALFVPNQYMMDRVAEHGIVNWPVGAAGIAKDDFDSFPMFSPDGRRLVFCSNRHNASPGDTNVFVADWVP